MRKTLLTAVTISLMGLAGGASAATFNFFATVAAPNECGGGGFDSCTLFGSPTIAKYNYKNGVADAIELNNTVFPSIDGTEFSVSLATNGSGTWSYSPSAPDPAVVTSFVVKAGPGYSIYQWDNSSGTDFTNISWDTSTLGDSALSHITFFDTGVSEVPLPAAGFLLVGALGSLAGLRRRRKAA